MAAAPRARPSRQVQRDLIGGESLAGGAAQLSRASTELGFGTGILRPRANHRVLALEHEKHRRRACCEAPLLAGVLLLGQRSGLERRSAARTRRLDGLQSVPNIRLDGDFQLLGALPKAPRLGE